LPDDPSIGPPSPPLSDVVAMPLASVDSTVVEPFVTWAPVPVDAPLVDVTLEVWGPDEEFAVGGELDAGPPLEVLPVELREAPVSELGVEELLPDAKLVVSVPVSEPTTPGSSEPQAWAKHRLRTMAVLGTARRFD
jgi:hypothetical protein